MSGVPQQRAEFGAAVTAIFGDLSLAGITLRDVKLAEGPAVTLVYCEDLLDRDDLRRLALNCSGKMLPAPRFRARITTPGSTSAHWPNGMRSMLCCYGMV